PSASVTAAATCPASPYSATGTPAAGSPSALSRTCVVMVHIARQPPASPPPPASLRQPASSRPPLRRQATGLAFRVMTRPESAELRTACEQRVASGRRMAGDQLAIGAAGNLSVRTPAGVAITPSGIGYHELVPADICVVAPDGSELHLPERPSSETPMHL